MALIRKALLSLLFLFPAALVQAQAVWQDPVILEGDFFMYLEPKPADTLFQEGPEASGPGFDKEEVIATLLEEARLSFSGRLYGYRFSYTPPDKTRGVAEEFRLELLAEIPWGDPGLSFRQGTLRDGNVYHAELAYRIPEELYPWYESWWSSSLESAEGHGSAPAHLGLPGKQKALSEAVKQALRSHFRPRFRDKPRRITGEAVLSEAPVLGLRSGAWQVSVRVRLRRVDILPYRVF